MLPKPEKNKKNNVNVEQLSLVDPLKKENNLKKKRLYVGLTLSLTVALSVSFSIYRYLQDNRTSLQLPVSIFKSQSPSLNPSSLDKDISSLLASEKNIWHIYANDLSNNYSYNWSQNKSDFAPTQQDIVAQIPNLNQTKTNSHVLDNVLPGGVTYFDNKSDSNNDLIYTALLIVPKKQIFIYLKISNGIGSDQPQIDKKISGVVEKIYWNLINL